MQSERMYQAVAGQGGICKLVILPHEVHGYRCVHYMCTVVVQYSSTETEYSSAGFMLLGLVVKY